MADPTLVVRVAANLSEFKSNLAEGVDQVETYRSALSRAAAAFDGSRIVQQASAAATAIQNAGGVTALTASEQAKANAVFTDAADKLQLMGKGGTYAAQQFKDLAEATKGNNAGLGQFEGLLERITARFAVYELLRGAFDFSKEVIEDTARIEELSLATGISADGVQRLSYVGRQFGIDAEQMARGVEQLSAKLANGDANATKAVEELGLSVQALIAAGPKEAFLEISEAVGRVEDPMLKNGLATELFGGKLAKVLIPALGELRQKMEDVPKDAIISDANVKAAHDFEVALGNLKVKAESWGAWILGGLSTYEKWLEKQSGVTESTDWLGRSIAKTTVDVAQQTEAVHTAVTAADLLSNRLSALRTEAMDPLSDTQKASITELEAYGVSHKEIAQLIGTTEIAVKRYTDAVKLSAEEAKKAAAVAAASTLEVTKLWDEFNDIASKGGGKFDDQIASIDKWALDLEAKAQKAGTDTAAFYEALTALWNAKLHEASQKAQTAMEKTADRSIQSFDSMNSSVMGIATSFDGWNKAIMGVDESLKKVAADKAALDKGNTLDLATAAQDPVIMELLHDGYSLKNAEAIKLSRQYGFTPQLFDEKGNPETTPSKGERVPGYADGVMNAPGGWAMVGERGPELMRVPQGANIYPSGAASGGNTIQIYITQPLGSPAAIASAIDQALTARQLNLGTRFPSRA